MSPAQIDQIIAAHNQVLSNTATDQERAEVLWRLVDATYQHVKFKFPSNTQELDYLKKIRNAALPTQLRKS